MNWLSVSLSADLEFENTIWEDEWKPLSTAESYGSDPPELDPTFAAIFKPGKWAPVQWQLNSEDIKMRGKSAFFVPEVWPFRGYDMVFGSGIIMGLEQEKVIRSPALYILISSMLKIPDEISLPEDTNLFSAAVQKLHCESEAQRKKVGEHWGSVVRQGRGT